MDLEKIGRYIAGKRKARGLTQRELAEILNMSDKSVSKWERGVCLPDVSVYAALCDALGISINEFLAGEDIMETRIAQKSEENLMQVAVDSKQRQRRLKRIILLLLFISAAALTWVGIGLVQANRPKNVIVPLEQDSIEMKTAKMLAGSDGAFLYRFTATDDFSSLKLFYTEYRAGVPEKKEHAEISYQDIGSPENGTILLVPDFDNFTVKLIIADDSSKFSTQIPILEDSADRKYLGRSANQIEAEIPIQYGKEQGLLALIYSGNTLRAGSIQEYEAGIASPLNDYVYFFSVQFCKA